MNDIAEISKKIEKKKQQFSELFTKDDENYQLSVGAEQIFDTHKMAINITGTELVSLALKIQASLVRSRLQIGVLPPDKYPNPDASTMANQEERMYYYGFDKANENLDNIGEGKLLPSMAWQATVLGRIAVRVLVYVDKGEVIWDYRPLNPRFLTFSFGARNLSWTNYETFRSAESIEEEYGVKVEDPGKGVAVCDYWDKEHNIRFLSREKRLLNSWKNAIGEVPVIIEPINMGPRAIDETGINVINWGQSIFDNVKVAFKKLNQMTSIAATHAYKLAANPEVYKYPEGQEPALEEDTIRAGALLKMPSTHTIEGLRIPDIPQSLMMIIQSLQQGIEKATYTELNPDRPGHSTPALRLLGQDKKDVLTPRMDALNSVYQRICRMVKRQIIAQKLTIPVNTVVNNQYNTFNIVPELLDNNFYVHAELAGQDVYDEVEALQRAQMMMQLRLKSREDVLEQVMQEQDTPTQIAKMDIEDVETTMPELKLKRAIKIYDERGMKEESGMVKEQLAMMEIQKKAQLQQMYMQGHIPQEGQQGIQGQPPQGGQPIGG